MKRKNRFGVLAAAVAGVLGTSMASQAAVSIWTGPSGAGGTTAVPITGNFSDATAWSPAGVPVSVATTELDFNGSGGSAYTATDDIAGNFTLNILKLTSTDVVAETISNGGIAANQLNFANNGATTPVITQAGSGAFNLNIGLVLTGTSAVSLGGAGTGLVSVNGVISGVAPLTFNGGATSQYTLAGTTPNTYTGATTVSSGVVNANSSGNAIVGSGLTVSGGTLNIVTSNQILDTTGVTVTGGTLALGANTETVGALNVTGGTLSGAGGGIITVSSTTISGGTISAIIASAGGLTKNGTGTGTLTAANTYTGSTTINSGTLTVSGGGSIITSSGITIGSTAVGILSLDNSATNLGDRVKDTANVTFANTGGTLNFTGNAASSTETIANLANTSGISVVKIINNAAGSAQLNAAALVHTNGAMDFQGTGGTLGTAGNNPRVVFATAPTLTNGIIGGWATVAGADFATYDLTNGVGALSAAGYIPLPTSGFSATTIYSASGDVTATAGGNIYALKLNPAANQTIDLGANNLQVDSGGIIKTGGTGISTINGSGTLTLAGEGVIFVNQGTVVVNAPLSTPRLTKPGAGKLVLAMGAAAPGWLASPVNFNGILELNTSTDQTITGAIGGATSTLIKSGPATLSLSNQNNSFTTFTVNSGILEAKAIPASQNVVFDNSTTASYFGNDAGGTITINGGTVKVTTALSAGNVSGNITVGRVVTFGANGGVLDLTNTIGGTLGGGTAVVAGHTVGGGSGNLPVTFASTASPAIIKFNGGESGISSNNPANGPAPSGDWGQGNNALRFGTISGATATTPLRVELTHGAMMDLLTVNNFAGLLTIAGPQGGDPGGSGLSLTNGKLALGGTLTMPQAINFQGALEVGATGAGQILDSSITIKGTASGNAGAVSFSGRGTGSGIPALTQGNVLDIGTFNAAGSNRTLAIEDGGQAILDARVRMDVQYHNPVRVNASTSIQAGGTLALKQSFIFTAFNNTANLVGYHEVLGDITGTGTTAKDSNIDISLRVRASGDAVSALGAYNFGLPGASGADYIVNGSGLGGLKILGHNNTARIYTANNPINEASLPTLTAATEGFTNVQKLLGSAAFSAASTNVAALSPARLAALKGSGGYLTVGADNELLPLAPGSEWAPIVPVGLKVINSNTSGDDVSLSGVGSWSHNLHVASSASLAASAVSVNGGVTSGFGSIASGTGANAVSFGALSTISPGPGTDPGAAVLTMSGGAGANDVNLKSGAIVKIEIASAAPAPVAGTDYDQIAAVGGASGGTVNLNADSLTGAVLNLALNAASDPIAGTKYAIMLNDANHTLSGTFAGLLDGASLAAINTGTGNSVGFNINYNVDGGDGSLNDVVLTVAGVPEPTTIGALGLIGTGLLAKRRRRA